MAIEAKTSFLRMAEKKLSTEVTADTMTKVLSIMADVMEGYDLREISIEEEQDDMLECFLEAMDVQSRSKKTIAHYRMILGQMLASARTSARRITVYHLRSYLARKKEEGLKDSTLAHFREVFSSFFGWLHREGLIEKNPVVNLGNIKVAKVEKKVFSDIDMELMRRNCRRKVDKAIICFLKATGCRISEVTALNRDDIDFINLECVVLGKGNKQRTVYIDAVTGMILQKYFKERQDTSPALFVGKGAVRLHPGGVRAMLNRIGEKAGVTHVHPHKFRRTEITELVNRGMAIEQVKTIAGHEKIDTTMGYVKIDQENVKSSYKKFA